MKYTVQDDRTVPVRRSTPVDMDARGDTVDVIQIGPEAAVLQWICGKCGSWTRDDNDERLMRGAQEHRC